MDNGRLFGTTPTVTNTPVAPTASVTPTQASTPYHPSILERLMPTAGAVLGGLGAGALDVASGGLAIPFDAAIAGAGAGLGKVGENALTGQKLTNGTLGASAGGAIGQGAGEGIGNLASKLLGGTVAKGATDLSGSLLKGQLAKGTMGSLDAKTLASLGINDARDLPAAANVVTGSGGALSKGLNNALMTDGSPVNVDGLIGSKLSGGMANDLVDGETAIGQNAGNKILGVTNKAVQNMMGGSQGSIGDQTADPLDVLQQSRLFRNLASTASDSATRTGNAEQLGVSKVYNGLADELETRLFNPNGSPVPLTDAVKSKVIDDLAPLKDISPNAYSNVVSDVTNAQNAQDLRPIQSLWVRASQAAGKTAAITDKGAGTSAADIARGAGVPVGVSGAHPLAAVGSALLSSPAANRAGAGILGKIGTGLGSGGAISSLLQPTGGVLGSLAGNLGNLAGQPSANSNIGLNNTALTSSNANTGSPTVNGQPSNLFQSLVPGSNVSPTYEPIALQAMLGMFDPSLLNSGGVEGNAANAEGMLQKAQTAESLLPQLEAEFNQAGGGQGLIGGVLSRLSGILPGSTASIYNKQAGQEAQALQAAGVPASEANLPSLTQNGQSAQDVLENVQSLLSALGATPQVGAAPTAATP